MERGMDDANDVESGERSDSNEHPVSVANFQPQPPEEKGILDSLEPMENAMEILMSPAVPEDTP
eukprot:scaffold8414_cov267-Pinguiococcus_pyrenoidosus.AAC.4